MTDSQRKTIDDIVETLRVAKMRGRGSALLIGAGCSVSAGIPTAAGIVGEVERLHRLAYERAVPNDYPNVMAELAPAERRDLIGRYVDEARVNWAHVCMAQLMKMGYVDRILTTNFDPLIVRACALIGLFPAVYDFAASQLFSRADIADHAIVYLHGQRSGFVLLNTRKEVARHARLLGPVFDEAGQGRVWIVVGYSGENDPVFNRLTRFPRFDNKLFWVGYEDSEPALHVSEKLLSDERFAFYTDGFNADSFFVTLLRKLDCFPPDFIGKPFTHLLGQIDAMSPYEPAEAESAPDFLHRTRSIVMDAIEQFERTDEAEQERQAQDFLLAGKLDEVDRVAAGGGGSEQVAYSQAWATLLEGHAFLQRGRVESGAVANRSFELAADKYKAALAIKPDMHEALANWGNALAAQARTSSGDAADVLFKEAYEKYASALKAEPDDYRLAFNWGNALLSQARTKSGAVADRLFKQASEKYEAALKRKPDHYESFWGWGNTLSARARLKTGRVADRLFDQATEKYAAAIRIRPDGYQALRNWGSALAAQARTKNGPECDRLFEEAVDKYAAATKIKPDDPETFGNWGSALLAQARIKSGAEADLLLDEASEKYETALKVKPDSYEALWGLGNALALRARTKTGADADLLFEDARKHLERAEAIAPGTAAYDLACLGALSGDTSACKRWLGVARRLGRLPDEEFIRNDSDLDSVRTAKWFSSLISSERRAESVAD